MIHFLEFYPNPRAEYTGGILTFSKSENCRTHVEKEINRNPP